MRVLQPLFQNNREWSERLRASDPAFFQRLSEQQNPKYLWIGCSDSRVPANQICLSALQFGIDVLQVEHVMVVGHYGCSGVHAALFGQRIGLSDNWLGHVRDVAERHEARIRPLAHDGERADRLCELNVIEQVHNVSRTTIVRDAWERGQNLSLHGWVYSLRDGLLRDLGVTAQNLDECNERHAAALQALQQ